MVVGSAPVPKVPWPPKWSFLGPLPGSAVSDPKPTPWGGGLCLLWAGTPLHKTPSPGFILKACCGTKIEEEWATAGAPTKQKGLPLSLCPDRLTAPIPFLVSSHPTRLSIFLHANTTASRRLSPSRRPATSLHSTKCILSLSPPISPFSRLPAAMPTSCVWYASGDGESTGNVAACVAVWGEMHFSTFELGGG